MTLVTQQDIHSRFPKVEWDSDRIPLAVSESPSLKDFIAHPNILEDEAMLAAINEDKAIGVSFKVRRALVALGIDRAVLKLEGSPLSEVRDFYDDWVRRPPIIKGEWDRPSEVFGNEVQRISNISCLAGDWQSFIVLQMIYKAHQMQLNPELALGILVSLRYAYVGLPDGWIIERNQQYRDLVRLIREMGE